MGDVTYREVLTKSALNRVQGMPFEWSLNPWTGCAHACRYCYARAYNARYRERDVGEGFDRNVEVKVNFADVLRAELRRHHEGSVAIGTATDPYQPIEGKYRLTRRCLQALAEFPMPTSLITKGTMVVRDIDVLKQLDAKEDVTVYFSIPTLREHVWRKAEPGTPAPWQRIRALRMLREAGLNAGVLCAPVLPGLSDSEASLEDVARAASEAGATAFHHRPLKIDLEIHDYYFQFLATEFPVLVPGYAQLYGGGSHADRGYERELEQRVARVRNRYEFRERPPRERTQETEQLQLAM
ncbi:MAG TPA: radical SAM protein [Candidatus Limnocylindria bacterium]|jgi:DNA repair photolyase|nr:radical SAM protein [Candidatus Limnocylindria bacterium]